MRMFAQAFGGNPMFSEFTFGGANAGGPDVSDF